jgi:hypothetical protein
MTNPNDSVDGRRSTMLWKALEIGALVVAVVVWFTSMQLWTHYGDTRPRIPEPDAGRIYQLNTHGSIAYLTRPEELLLYGLMLIAGISFVAAVCVDVFKRPFRRK